MVELKPVACPFCGKEPKICEDDFASKVTGETRYSVTCNNLACRASQTGWNTEERAVAAWNRRDTSQAQEAVRAARAEERERWPPIDSAPRDRSEIVAHDTATGTTHVTNWSGCWHDPDSHYYSEAPDFVPTHWRPLPPPPALDSTGGADA